MTAPPATTTSPAQTQISLPPGSSPGGSAGPQKKKRSRLVTWLFFNVLVSLLPFIFRIISYVMHAKIIGINEYSRMGVEILIICVAIHAEAIGTIVIEWENLKSLMAKVYVTGISLGLLILSALIYSSLSGIDGFMPEPKSYNLLAVTFISAALLIAALVSGAASKILTEG